MRETVVRFAVGLPACAVVGFVVGVLATFKARSVVVVGVPYGLVLGLLLALVLVVAVRLGGYSRWFGAAGGLGLVAAAAVLTLPSAGGSIVVALDPVGIAWLVGIVVAAVLGVAVPLPGPRVRAHVGADGILDADEGTGL